MGKGKRCKSARRANKNNLDNTIVPDKNLLHRKMFWCVLVLVFSIISVAGFSYNKFFVAKVVEESKTVSIQNSSSQTTPAVKETKNELASQRPLIGLSQENKSEFAKPVDVSTETVFMLPAELKNAPDTAKINLLCAKDLNGSEKLNEEECLKTYR